MPEGADWAEDRGMTRTGKPLVRRTRRLAAMPAVALALTMLGVVAASPATAAPANDNFSNATTIATSADSVTVGANNTGATTESGEQLCCFTGKTVWFALTASDARRLTIRTTGGFNTFLAVFTASNPGSPAVNALIPLTSSDDVSAVDTSSSVAFQPTVGTTYYLQLGSANGLTEGSTSLVLTKAALPVASTTTLSVPRKVRAGKKATIRVSVSTAGGPATGTVTVAVNQKITTLQLVYGTATFKTRKLRKPGKVAVAAEYQATSTTLASGALATIKVKRKPAR
jgi:hypothetical protein